MASEFLHELLLATLTVLTIPAVIVVGMVVSWGWGRLMDRVFPPEPPEIAEWHRQTAALGRGVR